MILYQNSSITLDYDAATDVLSVALPDIHSFVLSEAELYFQLIVETIRSYDVKKLLLDSSRTVVEVEDEQYRQLILQFSSDLRATRLQAIARIATPLVRQEQRASGVAEEMKQESRAFTYQNFSDKAAALRWLLNTIV